jgi:RNA polymerase sigma-70 factor (ECF subfamily)
LIFTCCHPSLAPDAQIALTLRAVAGLTTAEIARAFLIPEPTLAKRLTRAKQKIVSAGIPYRAPEPDELAERLHEVLRVIYLVFNEGYFTTSGASPVRAELVHDAEWLASLLVRWLPGEPEPLGLLALIRLHRARWRSRIDAEGRLVLLADQDRSLWDRAAINDAVACIERAATLGRVGPYQIEAAIAAVHCEAAAWEETDWLQLLHLYSLLAMVDPSPIVRLNRAAVLVHVEGPEAALRELDALLEPLAEYHLFHATRASILRQLGRDEEARDADREALRRTSNLAERTLLSDRIQVAAAAEPVFFRSRT